MILENGDWKRRRYTQMISPVEDVSGGKVAGNDRRETIVGGKWWDTLTRESNVCVIEEGPLIDLSRNIWRIITNGAFGTDAGVLFLKSFRRRTDSFRAGNNVDPEKRDDSFCSRKCTRIL